KRPGWGSVMRREWIILDAHDQEIGRMRQDSASLALLRSFVTTLLPQTFSFTMAEETVGTAKGSWNLFAPRMVVDFSRDPGRRLDRRLAVAGVVLLITTEGRLRWYDYPRDASRQKIWISGFRDGTAWPISIAGTPALINARVSFSASFRGTESKSPPAVCGSWRRALTSSGTRVS